MPSVSIVIPAFNRARFLAVTLESVLRQTFQDWECVVVDDGSTDGTSEIAFAFARRDPRVRVARTQNSGASAARNRGFALTDPNSEFVTFMDSDDVWLPHALETLQVHARSDPAAAGAHALAETIDENGEVIKPGSYAARGRHRLGLEGKELVQWPLSRPTNFSVLVNGNVLFPPGLVLAHRAIYEQVGGFDETLQGAEDWDMLIRISRLGYLAFVDDVILMYRLHDANLGARPGIAQQAWLVRCKGFHSPENTPHQQEIARRGWRAYQRNMIRERFANGRCYLRRRDFRRGSDQLARIPVHFLRVLRGYPRPRVVSSSQPWPSRSDVEKILVTP
jgi:glycosyltransferase involved in cell wall biosynthesis